MQYALVFFALQLILAQMGGVLPPSEGEAIMTRQQPRKNPLPAVRAYHQGDGSFLLDHGEPHDPCPVKG